MRLSCRMMSRITVSNWKNSWRGLRMSKERRNWKKKKENRKRNKKRKRKQQNKQLKSLMETKKNSPSNKWRTKKATGIDIDLLFYKRWLKIGKDSKNLILDPLHLAILLAMVEEPQVSSLGVTLALPKCNKTPFLNSDNSTTPIIVMQSMTSGQDTVLHCLLPTNSTKRIVKPKRPTIKWICIWMAGENNNVSSS